MINALENLKSLCCTQCIGSVPVTGPVVAQRVDRVIALLFYDHGTRSG